MTILQTDESGKIVADLGPPVPEDAPSTEPAVQPRPTLDVAIETHNHLRPRIESFCLRLESWASTADEFRKAVENLRKTFDALGCALDQLKARGFSAKSTPKTRKLARMKPGALVRLNTPEREAEYSQLYSPEELAALEVVRVIGSRVFLRTGTREVGLVPATHLHLC
jgi:hypothetical protein